MSEGLMGSPVSQVPRAVILGLVTSVLVAEMLCFASFLVLVRADVMCFNKSQNRKYVECLIFGTLPLGHMIHCTIYLKLGYIIKYCQLNSLTSFQVLCHETETYNLISALKAVDFQSLFNYSLFKFLSWMKRAVSKSVEC